MSTYSTLRQANIARDAEWDTGGQISATFRSTELAGETGEACNVVKKLERERLGLRGSRDTVDHLAEELADVVICVDLIAMHYGIDLESAIARKFNATSEKVGLKTRLVEPSNPAAIARVHKNEGFVCGAGFAVIEGLPCVECGATDDDICKLI